MSCACGCGCGAGCGCAAPCTEPPTSIAISNPSGLTRLAYRVGDFETFRRALLGHREGEVELEQWRPTGTDLGLQILGWWAYIADVLTFYNEQIANEDYLGTAALGTSVQHLVGLLGYRPRPGIGATAVLAAQAAKAAPLTLAAGLAIGSKATPEIPAQTFETTVLTHFDPPTTVSSAPADDLITAPAADGPPDAAGPGAAEVAPYAQLIARGGVLVKGTPSVAVGDQLLLIARRWNSADDPAAVVTVTGLAPEHDPYGRKNTRVLLSGTDSLSSTAAAIDFRLLRSTRSVHLATMPAGATVVTASNIVLDSPDRQLTAGDPLLVEAPGIGAAIAQLNSYGEAIWYFNAAVATPTTAPANLMPYVVSSLAVTGSSGSDLTQFQASASSVAVKSGWVEAGTLLATPAATLTTIPTTITLAAPPLATAGVARPALLEDANGIGAAISATPLAGTSRVAVRAADADSTGLPLPTALHTPVRVLWDLIQVTRGATVRDETIGTGDAARSGQDFALAKSPVTYLAVAPGRSGDGYSSTITLAVDGRYWNEVPSLYGHAANETIFETYEDDDGKTHVRFGDGEAGRRLATGASVVATYRVGSGGAVPAPGSLTQLISAVPNLRSVRNPVAPAGGADPEPASQTRTIAPRSVLTFGRAISGDDYGVVAAAAPGVNRAAAVWEWDDAEQRPMVRIYVGDDSGARASAKQALAAQSDPNRPYIVVPAVQCPASLSLSLRLDPTYVSDAVQRQVSDALVGIEGLFASGVLELGEPLYRSRIEEVVCAIPGVLAAHALLLRWSRHDVWYESRGPRFDPGAGGFFTLAAADLSLASEVDPDD